ncbi:MAG TPA: PIN domain-containing protein [Thermoanaerobaculia bacterium]
MQPQCFVDTWFLVALFDSSDEHHQRAKRIDRMVRNAYLFTHDGVLSEFLTHVADEGPRVRARAVEVVRRMLAERRVVASDRSLFLRALDLYSRRDDKQYSLVDCMSMTVMRERGVDQVLTNDHHFRQEGFALLNDAP